MSQMVARPQARSFARVANAKSVKDFGNKIPDPILQRADRVIE